MNDQPSVGPGLRWLQGVSPKRGGLLLLFLSAGMVLVQPCRGGSGGFDETGSLNTARYEHTATLLANGKVLVTGGDVITGSSAELYDPASGTWAATGSMVTYRTRHTATLLPNGKVLAAGGGYLSQTATAELYDPASGAWTQTGSLMWKRSEHTATLLLDGRVLVVGGLYINTGYGGWSLRSATLYDPATGTWTETGELATSRLRHTATLLANGKVLVAGGYDDYNGMGLHSLTSCELYEPQSGTWTTTGALGDSRDQHTATLLPDGRVLVAGGNYSNSSFGIRASAELYDPASATWTPTGPLTTARYNHTTTLLPDGTVLAAGGQNTFGYSAIGLDSAELYDPASGTWTATGSLGARRKDHTATLLPNNKVLVAGGNDSNKSAIASAELYVGPATFLNISTRLRVQTGDNAMIGGFILVGTQKAVIVRGIGPSLGVPGALADPIIEMHGPTGEIYATNDNWRNDPNYQHVIDSGIAPANDLESAFWGIVNPGAYTVTLRGTNGAPGIGLVEVYGLGQDDGARLANISTRGLVETGDDVMIGGLIVGGGPAGDTLRVLLRALGPSVPVAGALNDPTLELRNGSGTLVASNDNWKTRSDGSSQEAEIEATGIPPSNDLESAIVGPVPAGNYTAIVRGKNNTTGVGLIEAYDLQ